MRLIDADLFKREECLKCDGYCDICGIEKCISCKDKHRCDFIKELDNAPTVEAVPTEFHEKCLAYELHRRREAEKRALRLEGIRWERDMAIRQLREDYGVELFEQKPDTVDAVPVSELLKLRDWFYESDGISMGNLGMLNTLIKKYSSMDIPRLENGYERSGEK